MNTRPTVTREHCAYLVTEEDGSTELVQTDWEYPALAERLGWRLQDVQQEEDEPCDHSGTDGTITCQECGLTAGDFIASAMEYIDNQIYM